MIAPVKIIVRPRSTSLELKRNPRWLSSFLLLAAVSLIIEFFMNSYSESLSLNHLPASATQHDKVMVAQWFDQEWISRLAFHPVRLFAGWLLFSLALLYACRSAASREPFRFVQILALEVHAESALVLGKLALLLSVVALNDPPSRLIIPFSVAGFVDGGSFAATAFFNSLNLFTALYLGILAAGVSIICNVGRGKAFLIVLTVWGAAAVVNSGILAGLQDELHLIP